MRSVALSEAKDNLSQYVAAAAAGEEITITRHGRPAAKLVPVEAGWNETRSREAWERLKAVREAMHARGVRVTKEEWIAWKNEGRP